MSTFDDHLARLVYKPHIKLYPHQHPTITTIISFIFLLLLTTIRNYIVYCLQWPLEGMLHARTRTVSALFISESPLLRVALAYTTISLLNESE